MNKKLFFSLLLLSSAGIHAMVEDAREVGQEIERMAIDGAHKVEDMAHEAGNKIEAAGQAMMDKAEDMAGRAEGEAKNIFEKIKDFIMGIVNSIMNFFHGLFGG